MTLAWRNRILAAFAAIEMGFTGLCVFCIAGILLPPAPGALPVLTASKRPWIPEILPLLPDGVEALVTSAVLSLAGLLGGLWLAISFRRATSREFLCYGAFFCGLTFEALRAFIAWTSVSGASMEFIAFLTRSVWFGRTAGLLSLFLASIYSAGFDYEDPARALGVTAFAALVMASVIPVDTGKLGPSLLYAAGFPGTIAFVWLGVGILSALNLGIAAFRRSSSDYLWICAGLGLCILGRDGLMFPTDILINAAAALALGAGLTILVRRSYRRSLLE